MYCTHAPSTLQYVMPTSMDCPLPPLAHCALTIANPQLAHRPFLTVCAYRDISEWSRMEQSPVQVSWWRVHFAIIIIHAECHYLL